MNRFKGFLNLPLRVGLSQARLQIPIRSYKKVSPCKIFINPSDKKPCFDIRSVSVEFGQQCHARLIRSFLYTHYWPREPTIAGLWLPLDSPYLNLLTDKYSTSGNRLLAYERLARTGELKLVGVCVMNKIFPWVIGELEEWAHYTTSKPERNRMYFLAHCYRSPDVFSKFNVDYIYDVEVLATASEVTAQGVGARLLTAALAHAQELRHPLVHVVAVSKYTCKICEKVGMKRAWTMEYTDFVDKQGQRVFFPRRPHNKVAVYVKYNNLTAPPPPEE